MKNDAQAKNYAVCLTYLWIGFRGAAELDGPFTTYELHSDVHGGQLGIVDHLYDYAVFIEDHLSGGLGPDPDYPGVFHYEVTEELGAWIFAYPEATFQEFKNYAIEQIAQWFTPSTTANDPRPVGSEKGSTMKIVDLIESLKDIRDEHGNVDVLVRGSTPTSFVDAQEVRSVKTPKRRAVFIGKTSVARPQE